MLATSARLLPAWVWFLAGVISTVALQFFYHLSQIDPSQIVNEVVERIEPQATSRQQEKKPEFRFYDELKEREVEVSGNSVAEREQEDYNYALQAGSFKNEADADSLRAEILFLGLDAFIESKKNSSGNIWHRVIVGPFTSRSNLARARSLLINNDIKTMKIKRS